MLDTVLTGIMSDRLPRMNKDICDGIAEIHTQQCDDYINQIFRAAAESYPAGLEYVGYSRCTPYEEYREITRPPKPNRSFEMSRSDIYMNKYKFTFNGVPIKPRFIMLPYVGPGGIIHLKGTQYKVTPVLSGKVFNIEKGNVFMPTPRAPLCFSRVETSFLMDGRIIHSNTACSELFNMAKVERSKLSSSLVHYMLSEYGLTGMFITVFNVNIQIGDRTLEDLTTTHHVFSSRQLPPIYKYKGTYPTTDVRIAIAHSEYTPALNTVIGAVFYIIDQCVDACQIEDLDNPDLWLRLLPRFLFNSLDSEKKRYEEMIAHQDSVKRSMDPLTRKILMREGIVCPEIFDLFKYMTLNIDDMVSHHDVGTMYDQELTTVRHLMRTVVHNIFHCMFELKKLTGDRINAAKITTVMDSKMRRDRILSLEKHGEISADGIATDCKVYGATTNVVSQSKAASAGKKTKHNRGDKDLALLLHPSQVEIGTYLMMSKAEPSGRAKLNPFLYFSEGHYISTRPELEDYINDFKELLFK